MRVWCELVVLRPDGPNQAICARLERWPCEPTRRWPPQVLSASRVGRYSAAVAAALGWVGTVFVRAELGAQGGRVSGESVRRSSGMRTGKEHAGLQPTRPLRGA